MTVADPRDGTGGRFPFFLVGRAEKKILRPGHPLSEGLDLSLHEKKKKTDYHGK